jgi:hypothetical protein
MGCYTPACVYVLVNGFLFLMSTYGWRERPFNPIPALGWGLGLALHFVSVFVMGKSSGLRADMVRRERERIEREQNRQ